MRTAKLGELEVARIGLGAMGMSHGYSGAGSDDAESIRTIHRALDLGVTLIDTAEVYGPFVKGHPRFTGENFERNLRIADEVQAVADQVGATSAQVALAWLLAQGGDIVPIPGTKRVSRVEENTGADAVELTAAQVAALTALPAAEGGHHTEAQMRLIER